jgi:hypothetical protein
LSNAIFDFLSKVLIFEIVQLYVKNDEQNKNIKSEISNVTNCIRLNDQIELIKMKIK